MTPHDTDLPPSGAVIDPEQLRAKLEDADATAHRQARATQRQLRRERLAWMALGAALMGGTVLLGGLLAALG